MFYILTSQTLTVMFDGKPRSMHKGEVEIETWNAALEAIHREDEQCLRDLFDRPSAIERYFGKYGIIVVNDDLYYQNECLAEYPSRKAIEFVQRGLPAEPLVYFLQRLSNNPRYRINEQLYSFLEHCGMVLTPQGRFLAYKLVQDVSEEKNGSVLVDGRTCCISNNPGQVVTMNPREVDDDPRNACSAGLHVCAFDYLNSYGTHTPHARVILVEVDPTDVVAIPFDHDHMKMRVSRYRVIRVLERKEEAWDRNRPDVMELDDDDDLSF